MAQKVTVDNLTYVIKDILSEYADDVEKNVKEITHKIAQAGAKAVQSSADAKFHRTGKYARGWTTRAEDWRMNYTEIIHNKDRYRVAHLLEFPHAMRNGRRAPYPVAHIGPVEQQIITEFEEGIIKAVQ